MTRTVIYNPAAIPNAAISSQSCFGPVQSIAVALDAADEEDASEEGGAASAAAAEERLRRKLANAPRMRGVAESGSEEVEAELAREKQARLDKAAGPPSLEDYFSGFCEPADMHMPIRAKVTKQPFEPGTHRPADPLIPCSPRALSVHQEDGPRHRQV